MINPNFIILHIIIQFYILDIQVKMNETKKEFIKILGMSQNGK